MKSAKLYLAGLSIILLNVYAVAQNKNVITVKADKPYAAIQPTMWGVFF
ncbi:MAG: hypothetical protein WDO16_12850 [Bacteroidota bacterium]